MRHPTPPLLDRIADGCDLAAWTDATHRCMELRLADGTTRRARCHSFSDCLAQLKPAIDRVLSGASS